MYINSVYLKIVFFFAIAINASANSLNFPEPVGGYMKCIANEYCSSLGQKLVGVSEKIKFAKEICSDSYPESIRPQLDYSKSTSSTVFLIATHNDSRFTFAGNLCDNICNTVSAKNIPTQVLTDLTENKEFKGQLSGRCEHYQIGFGRNCTDLCPKDQFATLKTEVLRSNQLKSWGTFNKYDALSLMFSVLAPPKENYNCKTCSDTFPEAEKPLVMKDGRCIDSAGCGAEQEQIFVEGESGLVEPACSQVCPSKLRTKEGNCYFKTPQEYCNDVITDELKKIRAVKEIYPKVITADTCNLTDYNKTMNRLIQKYEGSVNRFLKICIRDLTRENKTVYIQNNEDAFLEINAQASSKETEVLRSCFAKASVINITDEFMEFLFHFHYTEGSPWGDTGVPQGPSR